MHTRIFFCGELDSEAKHEVVGKAQGILYGTAAERANRGDVSIFF